MGQLPGDLFIVEAAVGKEVVTGFDLGLLSYILAQTTEEKGSSPGTDTSR